MSGAKRDPVGAKNQAKVAIRRACGSRRSTDPTMRITMSESLCLLALLDLIRFFDRAGDLIAVAQVAAVMYDVPTNHVTGWQRNRASEALRGLARKGIIVYEPGGGPGARARISFPNDTQPPGAIDDTRSPGAMVEAGDRKTPGGQVSNDTQPSRETHPVAATKRTRTGGHTDLFTDPSPILEAEKGEKAAQNGSELSEVDTSEPEGAVGRIKGKDGRKYALIDCEAESAKVRAHFAEARAAAGGRREDRLVTRLLTLMSPRNITRARCAESVARMRDAGIGDVVIDEVVGLALTRADTEHEVRTLGWVEKTASDWYSQRTAGAGS